MSAGQETPGQAARAELAEHVAAIITAMRDHDAACDMCAGTIASVMKLADAYAEARQPQAAPGDAERVNALGEMEDRLIEAERTIDSYREEVSRLTADRDRLRGLLNEARIAEPGQAAPGTAAPELRTAWRLANERAGQIARARAVCEGASAGMLANTPRGRLAKAVLAQLDPE